VPGAGRRSEGGIGRRALLAALAGGTALAGAGGCTGWFLGQGPAPAPRPYPGPYRLRIAIFELRRLDLPFHTGLLIDAPQGRILYDPAGHWRHDACQRHADVHHPMTEATVTAFLNRDGFDFAPQSWQLHLFEARVSPATAARAHDLALGTPPALAMHCTGSVSALLSRLPEFADIRPSLITAQLLAALRTRPDLRYETRRVPALAATG